MLEGRKTQTGLTSIEATGWCWLLRWVNFKISVSKEKPPKQRRYVATSATIEHLKFPFIPLWTV
jgi:hypothetical protein